MQYNTSVITASPYYENYYIKLLSQIVGYVAEFSIVMLNIPQIILIVRKKSGKNVSVTMILFNIMSGVLFLAYGLLIYQWPMILGNSLYILVSCAMLAAKYVYKQKLEGPVRPVQEKSKV